MDYKRIYDQIVSRAKKENRSKKDSYYELHHIKPKSLGGNSDKENLVLLTAREHFLAHWILYKITENEDKCKMAHAWFSMTRSSNNQKRYNSKQYEYAKKAHAIAVSKKFKGRKISKQEYYNRVNNNPNKRTVFINNIVFNSVKEAASFYKISSLMIRKYEKGLIDYQYLVDSEHRKKIKSEKISKSLKGKNKNKTYEDLYGENKAKKLKEKRRLQKIGKPLSDKTKQKMSLSNKGKTSWNKGKFLNEEIKTKMSIARGNESRSYKSYKIIDPNGKEYIIEKKGLRYFWKYVLNEKFPTIFKKVSDYKEGRKGKWKGWKVYVL